MKLLDLFRKPYLAFLVAIILLFASCNQYEVQEEKELKNISFDFEKLKNDIEYISNNVVDRKVIHNFVNFKKILKANSKNGNYTENDYLQAKELLIQAGWDEGTTINPNTVIEYVANQLKQNLLISDVTENFIIQNFKSDVMSNPQQFNLNVQSLINTNNLTDFEIQFLTNVYLELIKTDGCDIFGSVLGFGVGLLVGLTGWGAPVSGIAGGFVALAAADVCDGISSTTNNNP